MNYLDRRLFLLGVVPLEIGLKNNYYFEALKCAAVAGRTFAIVENGVFDVTDGVKDQTLRRVWMLKQESTAELWKKPGFALTYQKKACHGILSCKLWWLYWRSHWTCKFTAAKRCIVPTMRLWKSPSYRWTESYAFDNKIPFDAQLIKSKNTWYSEDTPKQRTTSIRQG